MNADTRELKNVIERAMILCKEDLITTRHLILPESPEGRTDEMTMDQMAAFLIGNSGIDLENLENRMGRTAMTVAKKNISRTARLLHLNRPTLRYRLERLGIGR